MNLTIDKNKSLFIVLIALISVAIPIIIIVFELITTEKESVVFLENYPPAISMLILSYYGILLAWGIVWLVKQFMFFVKLRNETVKNELQHLQSQVNPHFFFNVLNNLYGIVDEDAKKAQQIILKLSEMMRYSIYDGQKEMTTVAQEIAYLKNYVDLHKMRYHKSIEVSFEINIEDEQKEVMPLMFIILLENAFKHGVGHLRTNAYIHIQLYTEKDTLVFKVENNFDQEEVNKLKGVGLANLKRRLELVYPKKHTLSTTQTDAIYKAQLTLNP